MMTRPITKRQLDVLLAIHTWQVENGISPTLEELGKDLGVNRVTVFGHVQALIQKGYLANLEPGASRGLDLTNQGKESLCHTDYLTRGASPFSSTQNRGVPLLGRIAAGQPIEALENPQIFEASDLLPQNSDMYMLEVQGDSMIEDHIQNGDLILVRKDVTPEQGQIVVAILPGEEATLKRLYKEPKGIFRLQPSNSKMEPIFTSELEVRGVVVSVIRQY
jgi:repressor LexA